MHYRSKGRALAVDDDPAFLASLRLMLRMCRYREVDTAPDVESAWSRIRAAPPNLIVSDWNMAPRDGLDLLARVRGDARLARTPFILVTASLSETAWRGAISGGASDFLIKPFSLDQLRAAADLACAIEHGGRATLMTETAQGARRPPATLHHLFKAKALRG